MTLNYCGSMQPAIQKRPLPRSWNAIHKGIILTGWLYRTTQFVPTNMPIEMLVVEKVK